MEASQTSTKRLSKPYNLQFQHEQCGRGPIVCTCINLVRYQGLWFIVHAPRMEHPSLRPNSGGPHKTYRSSHSAVFMTWIVEYFYSQSKDCSTSILLPLVVHLARIPAISGVSSIVETTSVQLSNQCLVDISEIGRNVDGHLKTKIYEPRMPDAEAELRKGKAYIPTDHIN